MGMILDVDVVGLSVIGGIAGFVLLIIIISTIVKKHDQKVEREYLAKINNGIANDPHFFDNITKIDFCAYDIILRELDKRNYSVIDYLKVLSKAEMVYYYPKHQNTKDPSIIYPDHVFFNLRKEKVESYLFNKLMLLEKPVRETIPFLDYYQLGCCYFFLYASKSDNYLVDKSIGAIVSGLTIEDFNELSLEELLKAYHDICDVYPTDYLKEKDDNDVPKAFREIVRQANSLNSFLTNPSYRKYIINKNKQYKKK